MTSRDMRRRDVVTALTATLTALAAGQVIRPGAADALGSTGGRAEAAGESWTTQTLEAFADTLIPGQRRYPGDLAVAGAVTGPGAVQAGVVDVLTSPDLPLAPLLPEIAALLDARAVAYALDHLVLLPVTSPPFVGLSFAQRTDLVAGLFRPGTPDRPVWQILGLVTGLAFDTAATLDTAQAVAAAHPGLAWLHFPPPDADGLWRFPQFSYGRALADTHPATTASGSPA
ncbi:DUF5987 family protein [Actinacidiphila rubida]|uniref:Tat pathway signal sequence domain protein n=1 Tax=Actinacidiphila rubida TaxID=310780 RepID=A0A1H8PYP0_9ACTN|nr:DUF5987 family protein [Actinacidiphila rubida]SEO47109.1 hypothetical protein SAMN05216267_102789 [Actinacidiphila rubida]